MSTDDRERPTDPIASHAPLAEPGAPPMLEIPPDARIPEPHPDPNSFADWAMVQLLGRVRGLEADRGAMTMADFEAALERNAHRILLETSADTGLIRSSIHGLQQSVDALVTRIGNTETALDAGTKRFAAIEDEMAAMRSQMDRLEQMRDHLGRLEAAVDKLKQEGIADVTAQPAEAPKLDNPASG